ncbi:MAG: hypothetical protein K5865_06755 [Eubacterium sp.]|nr:hypothetical protein [Eubacterium sp.]
MELYTTLEQAVHDSSIAIISDSISTEKELTRTYLKYKTLPKRMKRFSDYYSNRFLGHSVPDMYVLIKEKLSTENVDFESWQPTGEKFMLSEPDLYYKEDSFNSGDTNICFILGHSGSGKSMMARTLEGNDIDHIELDDLLLVKDHFTMDELKDYSDMFYSFFANDGAKYYIGAEERDSFTKEEYEDQIFIDFVRYADEFAKKHKDKKYIIDGIWIYLYFDDPSFFENYAVFIKGTSFLKSKLRTMKREMQRDKEEIKSRKQMFGREVRNYLLDEDKINAYRIFFGNKSETILRAETNEAAKKDEAVVNELNLINEYFANENADGINEILKKAEANTDLSEWNKIRIISECKSALTDLSRQA